MNKCFSFLFVLFIYLLLNHNSYEYFHPNEEQYAVCSSDINKGETVLNIKENKLTTPLKGFYTSLLEESGEKKYNQYFKTPSCSLIPGSHSYFNTNLIIDHSENNWKPLPRIKEYAKYKDDYSIIYPNIFNDIFVQQHTESIKNDPRF